MEEILELNDKGLENVKLRSEIQVAYGHVRSQEVKIQGLSNQNGQLQNSFEALHEAYNKEIDGYKKQGLHLQIDIDALKTDLHEEKKNFNDQKERLTILQRDLDNLRNDIKQLELFIEGKDIEIGSLKDRIGIVEKDKRSLLEVLNKLIAVYNDSVLEKKNLQKTITDLQNEQLFLSCKLLQVEKSNASNLIEIQTIDNRIFVISSQLIDTQVTNNKLLKVLYFADRKLSHLIDIIDEKDSDIEYYQSKSNVLIKQLAAAKADNIKMQIAHEIDLSEERGVNTNEDTHHDSYNNDDGDDFIEEYEEEKEKDMIVARDATKKRKFVTFNDAALAETIHYENFDDHHEYSCNHNDDNCCNSNNGNEIDEGNGDNNLDYLVGY